MEQAEGNALVADEVDREESVDDLVVVHPDGVLDPPLGEEIERQYHCRHSDRQKSHRLLHRKNRFRKKSSPIIPDFY